MTRRLGRDAVLRKVGQRILLGGIQFRRADQLSRRTSGSGSMGRTPAYMCAAILV